jgi:hypothetical protein
MGIVYHLIYFALINEAATAFGIIFIIQGALFFYFGVLRHEIQFGYRGDLKAIIGFVLILYALLIYPLLGHLQERIYPSTPTFGLPCPTTIFTFGLLLCTNRRYPRSLLIIPLLWSIIGTSAAVKFGIKEDLGLLASGILCLAMVLFGNRRKIS